MALNPVTGFERDPMSLSQSAGEYRFADGTTLYADDPELYSQAVGQGGGGGNLVDQGLEAYGVPAGGAPPAPAGNVRMGRDVSQTPEQEVVQAQKDIADQEFAAAQERQQQEFLRTHKRVPFKPGVTGEQLQNQAASGVEIPVATSTQVSPGLQDTEEAKEARADQSIEERLTAQKRADFERSKLQNQVSYLDQQTVQIQDELAERKRIQNAAKAEVDKRMNVLDMTERAYREHKVDPERYFNERGTFAKIGAAIAQGLGAYGAALTGSQNFAQQIIDNLIERDIAVQKLEHQQLGEAADNAYTRLLQVTGDSEEAEAMLRATQQRLSAVERERFATETGVEEVNIAHQEWETAHGARRLEQEELIRERAMGRTVQTMQSQVAFPRAPSGGGFAQKTPEEIRKETLDESRFTTELAENAAKRGKADEQLAGGAGTKVDPLYVEGFGQAATQAEAVKVRTAQAEGEAYVKNLLEMKRIYNKPKSELTMEDWQKMKLLNDQIAMGIAKRGGGVVQAFEKEEGKKLSPGAGFKAFVANAVTGSEEAKIDALIADSENLRRELINQAVQGQHPELPESGAAD